jgi:glycosyltransferase involved in cell wall biosynthesis
MTVSVLLAAYEAADYLQDAVDSVFAQTYQDWELVAVDDNSADPRVMQILDAAGRDPRVFVVHLGTTEDERRQSVRYATIFNLCAEIAEGALTFLCGDDFYYPDRLERMVAKLAEGNDVVYGAQRLVPMPGEYGERVLHGTEAIRHCQGVLTDAYHKVDLNSVMVTHTAFDMAGGFPDRPPTPQMWREADALFWRRLTFTGYVFFPVDDPERPTDAKRYRNDSVDARVIRGETPW